MACLIDTYKYVILFCLFLIYSECCRFGSEINCAFECRCKGEDEVCNSETGECESGCAETLPPGYGWGGPGCRIGNIAYNKTAEQEDKSGRYNLVNAALDGNASMTQWNLLDPSGPQTCSHPYSGWWMVDLGVVSVIHNITIYNRLAYGDRNCCEERIRYFGIKVGLTSDPSKHQHCYTNDGTVKSIYDFSCDGGYMEGRYVQMFLVHSDFDDVMNFCEFIVIGHPKIDCSMCEATCNEITGCERCGPGLMLPDCKDSCPDGYAGVNCMTKCSLNCGKNDSCDQITGHCPGECQQWWVPDGLCNIYIGLELQPEENKILVIDTTSNSITIQWKGVHEIPQSYENHYQYSVHYKSTSNKDNTVTALHNTTKAGNIEYNISGLDWNTNYTIWITPYRLWKQQRDAGETIGVASKTSCADPDPPLMEILDSDKEFLLEPQNADDLVARCDRISSYYLSYECQTDGGFSSSENNISVLNSHEQVIYYGTTLLSCTAWLDVWNNEGFSARTMYSFSTMVTEKTKEDSRQENGIHLGIIIGASIGVLLICVVAIVVFVVVRRRKRSPPKSREQMEVAHFENQQTLNPGFDNDGYDSIKQETHLGPKQEESNCYESLDVPTQSPVVSK